jgi:PAS domain S-box-containing protein
MARVLIVDDELSIRETLGEFLVDAGHQVARAQTVAAAKEILAQGAWDVVVTDIVMPQVSGLELLRELHGQAPRVKVILITGEPSIENAAEGLRHGAFDFLPKPVRQHAITHAVSAAAHVKALEDENLLYQHQLERLVEERTRQIRDYTERLHHIAEHTKGLAQCHDVRELAPRVLALFSQNMDADGGSFYLVSSQGLDLLCSLDPAHQPRHIPLPPRPGSVLASVLERRQGFVVREILQEGLDRSGWSGYRDGSLLALPCIDAAGAVQGIVTLHNKRQPPFGEEDLEIGRIIAAHSVEAIRAIELNRMLRVSERRYKQISERSLVGIYVTQGDRLVYVNPRLAGILGYSPDEASGLIGQSHLQLLHPDDRPRILGTRELAGHGEQSPEQLELRFLHRDGQTLWAEVLLSIFEHEGLPAVMGNVIDITERRRVEDEKAQVEAQLVQSQKMEAIGRLAGGIAHDFNNLLTAILGYAEMILESLGREHPLFQDASEILHAAERAATLTRQLLAFSRKQIIAPRTLDLNQALVASQRMLARLIGEDVKLAYHPAEDLWPIRADPGQIDQILVNLATNAREAMPAGGQFLIRTENVTAARPDGGGTADYVRFSASDSGEGMDPDTRQRIFEPFFSTKANGTGLGLATVYGIMQQHEGFIEVESERGRGTTFRLLFPRAQGKVSEPQTETRPKQSVSGTETVLLVEDDPTVRSLVQRLLTELGYDVLVASDGLQACALARKHEGMIHLLLTDVVMPGMNGRELYRQLLTERPQLRALFVSGYTDEVIARHGVLEAQALLLQKPFSQATLAASVRAAIDG